MHRRSNDEDDEPSDEEEDDEPVRKAHRSSSSRKRRAPPPPRPRPIRRWRGKDEADTEEDIEALKAARPPRATYWRFRDSFWFPLLVALVVLVIVVGGLVAFTQNWPPIYVVESSSMQHGPNDVLGIINTGDLVLSQKSSNSSIVTYVAGMKSGFETYGEYGDVLLYSPNGQAGATPIIHRAILYLEYNPNNETYSAPALAGLPCGSASNAFYTVSSSLTGCGAYGISGTLTLYGVGWMAASVPIDLDPSALGAHSGYVTLGDYNFESRNCARSTCVGVTDQGAGISQLVEPAWIVGVARGMLPWFGALRLALTGTAAEVPSQSWELMALTIVAIILAAFALHYAWRSFRPPDRRRRAVESRDEREEEADAEDRDEGESRWRSWFHRRARGDDEEDGGALEQAPARGSGRSGSGRPSPRVRRSASAKRPQRSTDDEL